MMLGETVAVAFQSIRANKMRSLLTMLGIVIGVGAVITMVALGSGAQKAVEDRITSLGANLLNIYPGQQSVRGVASDQRVCGIPITRAMKYFTASDLRPRSTSAPKCGTKSSGGMPSRESTMKGGS